MLGIDDCRNTAGFLHLCHRVDSEGRLTGRLRTVDLDDTSFRITADAQSVVQTQTTRRNHGNVLYLLITQTHDGALSEVFVNLCHRVLQRFQFVCRWSLFFCHNIVIFLIILINRITPNLSACKITKKKAHTQVCAHFFSKNLQNSAIPHCSHLGLRAWHTYRPCSSSQ